ncbi:SAF domain [Candidatus Sulfopaludibacter sp. SbA3]|nr:SAF domain [Candidatus Sulfopaludibacter sp. SbA3]
MILAPALFYAAATTACHSMEGDKVRGSDLAAASAAFAAAPPDAVAGYAPQPGMRRIFDAGELERFARANHFEVAGVTALCFERAAALPDPQKMQEAMRKVLGEAQVTLEIVAFSQFHVPAGEMVFPRESLSMPGSDGAAVWNGYVAYEGGHFPLWARVHLSVRQRRLVAAAELKPGHVLEAQDVRVEEADEFPSRTPLLASPEEAVGRMPRRVLAAGTPLSAGLLEEANEVERGQTLIAEARSGAAVVKLEVRAETSGKHGQTISLRNPSSGKLFRARVEGKGLVVVEVEAPQ